MFKMSVMLETAGIVAALRPCYVLLVTSRRDVENGRVHYLKDVGYNVSFKVSFPL